MRLAGSKDGDGWMPERQREAGPEKSAHPSCLAPARKNCSRRGFLAAACAGTLGTAHAHGSSEPLDTALPQIGILVATTYTTGTLEERLDEVKAHSIACVQMSLSCAGLPDMPLIRP